MPRKRPTSAERAESAQRESKTLDFKERFDPSESREWPELLKDFVAMANSGGGLIIVGVQNNGVPTGSDLSAVLRLDPATIADKVAKYTGDHFAEFEIIEATRQKEHVAIIEIGAVKGAPLVFQQVGSYVVPDSGGGRQQQKTAFSKGTVYFRHGAKSEPATRADLQDFLDRRVAQLRKDWLGGIREVVEAPEGSHVAVVETVEEQQGVPTQVRLTSDPNAPVFGRLAPDQTHPFRQTELIDEVNSRLDGYQVNTRDLLSVRRVYDITEATHPEYTHEPKWTSPQYSMQFADWLVAHYGKDPDFFRRAKQKYGEAS